MRTRGENFLKEEEALLFSERGFFRGVGGKFVFLGSFGAWLQRKGKNRFLGFAKWFSLWSVAPPARGAGGIPTSPLCPPGPPIPPSNGRGIPPGPPCAERGTSPCCSTDRVRIGHAIWFGLGPATNRVPGRARTLHGILTAARTATRFSCRNGFLPSLQG